MIQPLQEAVNIWQNPQIMLQEWDNSPEKTKHEYRVANMVGDGGKLVELGCGNGRHAQVLNYQSYIGYDSSYAMIEAAKQSNPNVDFAIADIFKFQSDESYDTLLLIDVAIHQNDPVAAVKSVLYNWYAQRYFVTLLVGNQRLDLYNSTVVDFEEILSLYQLHDLDVVHTRIEQVPNERFAWVLIEFYRV